VIEHARVLLAGAVASSDESAPRRLLAPEYRLSDETSFPGILADAYASWLYLVNDCGFHPGRITIAGDSAGGNLALALTRYVCKEHIPSLPVKDRFDPIADSLILFSPWVDFSLSHLDGGKQASAVKNRRTDFLALHGLIGARDAAIFGLPAEAVESDYMSSIRLGQEHRSDLFEGFPRALLFYGGLEGFADECKTLQQCYNSGHGKKERVHMTAFEEPLGTHDFCALPVFAEEKERCIERVSGWI
jgi:acetyl esterase/lipase